MLRFIFGIVLATAIGAVLAITTTPASPSDTPALQGRVNDYAGKLSLQQKASMANQLRGVEPGAQMVVLLPASLDGQDVATYAGNTARAWKLGMAGKDNGVLLVLAPVERKCRIEVGYGLEPVITDTKATAICVSLRGYLKKGSEDWYGALSSAVSQIKAQLKE